ncbi:MAG: hypothetical protein ACOC84_02125 [Actinomycetota bacterium]
MAFVLAVAAVAAWAAHLVTGRFHVMSAVTGCVLAAFYIFVLGRAGSRGADGEPGARPDDEEQGSARPGPRGR